jgi:hypothetical protein
LVGAVLFPAYFKPTAGKSPQWNRGAYIVEALGHCSDCHSPRNIMGAIKGKAQFTGTEIDGFYAPDIRLGRTGADLERGTAWFNSSKPAPSRNAPLSSGRWRKSCTKAWRI